MTHTAGPTARAMLPAHYVWSPAQEVYNPRLSDAHFRTLAQIRGLAYKTKGERTPPLSVEDLAVIRGTGRTAILRHLRALRAQGYIRIEPSGDGRFVIYPLRCGPGAALPALLADGQDRLTAAERAALFGCAGHGCADLENETHHDHVVVVDSHDAHHEHENQQLHHHDAARRKNETGADDLVADLAGVLTEHGMRPDDAREKALRLVAEHGADVCARQRQVFERRCELARASRRGLDNPIGLLCASIRGDWPLPAAKKEKQASQWYTDAEFEEFFKH